MKSSRFKIVRKGAAANGVLWVITGIGIIVIFGVISTGGMLPILSKLHTPPPPGSAYTCCDTGDGPDCHPILEKQITYNGDAYALLKSNIVLNELGHYLPTNKYTPDNHRIFIGTSDRTANYSHIEGCEQGKDLIRIWPTGSNFQTREGRKCFGIPNDELIYVCKDTQEICSIQVRENTSPFDVYYRIKDGPVPVELSTMCPKPAGTNDKTGQQVFSIPTPGGKKNLQLETFQIKQHETSYEWLNNWCKPAIYLYPTEKTTVNVKVQPKGKFTLTIPSYPKDGWTVTAYPDGKIETNKQFFPYLYYEAAIEDQYVREPEEGYIVAPTELETLFNTLLPQLGLSATETKEFSEYWLKALPESPYYFVGLIPQTQIDTMAPLTISPTPDSLLRVSLYFKLLENNNLKVTPPNLTNFTRNGFTVTEWGGLVKTDKNHPFTCLM